MSCYGSLANSASNLASYSDGNKDGFKNKNTDFHQVQHILSQNKSTGVLDLRNMFVVWRIGNIGTFGYILRIKAYWLLWSDQKLAPLLHGHWSHSVDELSHFSYLKIHLLLFYIKAKTYKIRPFLSQIIKN